LTASIPVNFGGFYGFKTVQRRTRQMKSWILVQELVKCNDFSREMDMGGQSFRLSASVGWTGSGSNMVTCNHTVLLRLTWAGCLRSQSGAIHRFILYANSRKALTCWQCILPVFHYLIAIILNVHFLTS